MDKLNSVGFEWQSDLHNVLWDRKFAMYCDFIKANGIACAPQKKSILSDWISGQRTQYRKGILLDDWVNKLHEIGFLWKAAKRSERIPPRFLPDFAQVHCQKIIAKKRLSNLNRLGMPRSTR